MRYRCPVCMYNELPYPPADYHVCPCCGTEFGNDDAEFSHVQLREMWIASGGRWFFGNPPPGWNWVGQFFKAGLISLQMKGIEQDVRIQRIGPEVVNQRNFSYFLTAA